MKVIMNVSKNEVGPPEPKMFKKTYVIGFSKEKNTKQN